MPNFKRKRKQITKKADAILIGDTHIRQDTPICRTDDFLMAQFKKLNFIFALANEHNAPILIAGDIGNKPQWPNWLLEKTIEIISQYKIDIFGIFGQHDLPGHQISQWKKSGCGVLHGAGVIKFIQSPKIINNKFMIYPFSYGEEIVKPEKDDSGLPKIAITHQMIVEKKDLFPNQKALKGHQLLKKFPQFSIILSGDNHIPFIVEYNNKRLINAGSMMRSTTSQTEYLPRAYLWYAEENKVQAVYLPIEKNVISRSHIEITEQRSDRMDAYLARMRQDVEIELSFEQNIEEYFKKNRTQMAIKDKVFVAMEI